MKNINIELTDQEFLKLKKARESSKYSRSWRDFFLRYFSKGHSVHKELKK